MAIYYLDPVGGNDANAGTSFALRWRTITAGATAARIAPGDTIRLIKTDDPTSLGINATFTNISATIALASALTASVDVCDAAWTASASVTATANAAQRKQGTACCRLAIAAGFTTGLVAYHLVPGGTTDFSAYQQISFWYKANGAVASGVFELRLCSDAAGVTAVDTFTVPACPSSGSYQPCTINKGAALGSAIQSVALYALSDPGTVTVDFDNILAVKAPGADALSLTSLIGKNTSEGFHCIKSITGTSIDLERGADDRGATDGLYGGVTETVTAYKREPLYRNEATPESVQDSGTSGSPIVFSGGWNTTDMSTQTGETWWSCLRDNQEFLTIPSRTYIKLEKLGLGRGNYCLRITGPSIVELENIHIYDSVFYGIRMEGTGILSNMRLTLKGDNTFILCGLNGITMDGGECLLLQPSGTIRCSGNLGDGIQSAGYVDLFSISSAGRHLQTIDADTGTRINIRTLDDYHDFSALELSGCSLATITGSVTSVGGNGVMDLFEGAVVIANHASHAESTTWTGFAGAPMEYRREDIVDGSRAALGHTTNVSKQDASRHTASGRSWRMAPDDVVCSADLPAELPLARFAVNASALVTVKAFFNRSHQELTGRLICRGGQLAGLSSDTVATVSVVGGYEEISISFTPTEAGVVEIHAEAYGGTTRTLDIDDLSISQVGGLPANTNTLDISWRGEPFCEVAAKRGVDLQTMDYSYQALPFVSQDIRDDAPLNGQPIWRIPPQEAPWVLAGPWLRSAWAFKSLSIPEKLYVVFPGFRIPPSDPPWKMAAPWLLKPLDFTLHVIGNISAGASTIVAVPTSGIPNDGIENATIFITIVYDNGTPVYQASVVLSATGLGNLITQPSPTDINGQTIGYIASTVIGTKVVIASSGAVVFTQQPTIAFVHPASRREPPQGNGLQADAANGRWYRVLENETPVLTSSQFGPTTRPYTFWDAPVQLSKTRNTAWQWQVDTAGVFSVRQVAIERAHIPYFEFISPAGTSFVLQLDDAGAQTLVAFPESLRNNQEWVLANQPGVVYIPDTRFPPPRGVSPR